jgi:hypothetical protein
MHSRLGRHVPGCVGAPPLLDFKRSRHDAGRTVTITLADAEPDAQVIGGALASPVAAWNEPRKALIEIMVPTKAVSAREGGRVDFVSLSTGLVARTYPLLGPGRGSR